MLKNCFLSFIKQWFSFCLPHRITENQQNRKLEGSPDNNEASPKKQQQQTHKIDFNLLFKQKKKPKETATTAGNTNEQVQSKKKQHSTGYKPRTTVTGNKTQYNKFK